MSEARGESAGKGKRVGGITVSIMMAMAGALALAVLGAVFVALLMLVAAVVVSIVFACGTKQRHEQGRKLHKGLLAIPIVLFVISVPILVWFVLVWVLPFAS